MKVTHTYTWFWTDRTGVKCSVDVETEHEDYDAARFVAIQLGYPGHAGGWWNWFVEDSHKFLTRMFGMPMPPK